MQDRVFSLTDGGPTYRVLRRLGLTAASRCWSLGLLVWLPLALGEALRLVMGEPVDPILLDLSLHVRLLFALPVLLAGERLLDDTVQSAMRSFYCGKFCDPTLIDRICDRAERLRDSGRVELVMLLVAFVGGQLVLWSVFGATGLFHGGGRVGQWSFPRVWYTLVALPLCQFVMFRWLWRWLIWSYMLVRLSRLRLALLATHADGAAGLAGLARPATGFSAFVLGIGATLSGAWATQLLAGHATLPQLLPLIATFLVLALVVAVSPLLLFTFQLFRARRRTLARYGDFVRRYMLDFDAKWVAPGPGVESPLGSSDIQSLNDIGGAFGTASKTRMFVFGPSTVLTVWLAGVLPIVPLFVGSLTVEQILQRIARTVLGGLPL